MVKKVQRVNLIICAICFCVYTLNLFFKKTAISYNYQFIRNHLNDLIAIPAILSAVGIFHISKASTFLDMVLICSFGSLIREYWAPTINPNSVSDYKDIICYFAGGLFYWLIIKKYKE